MSTYSIIRTAIIVAVFIILGIMFLTGKVDKFYTKQKGIEKYNIKRLRLLWGLASILIAVFFLFRDSIETWYVISDIIIVAFIVTFIILQETWAKKKDSDS